MDRIKYDNVLFKYILKITILDLNMEYRIHSGMSGTFANNTELYTNVRILYQISLYISVITNQSESENNRVCDIWESVSL